MTDTNKKPRAGTRSKDTNHDKRPYIYIIAQRGRKNKEFIMRQLKIDPEFRDKVPPLTDEERQTLEENILHDGRVTRPIAVWNGTIVDGHNRYSIVQKHPEIPFDIVEMEFADRYEAEVWICKNQLGQRNLTPEQKTYLIGKQYEAQKKTVSNAQGVNQHSKKEVGAQNGHKPRTADMIAKEHGIGRETVKRAEKYAHGVDAGEEEVPGFKQDVLSGKIEAPLSAISAIPAMPVEERRKVIKEMQAGTYKKKNMPTNPAPRSVNTGFNRDQRELKAAIDSAVANLYSDGKDVEFTQDDLEEDLRAIIQNFTDQLKRSLTIRRDILKQAGAKERMTAVLADAEKAIHEIKEDLK